MVRARPLLLVLAASLLAFAPPPRLEAASSTRPVRWLWAWERPEDLRFLAARSDTGVAYLAESLVIDGEAVRPRPRHQPLAVDRATRRLVVVRLDAVRGSPAPRAKETIARVADRAVAAYVRDGGAVGLQIDFDAPPSLQPFYAELLGATRERLDASAELTITAIASWCTRADSFLARALPLDGVVPMEFAMGPDARWVRAALDARGGYAEPRCTDALGVSMSEPIPRRAARAATLFAFSREPWTARSFERLVEETAR